MGFRFRSLRLRGRQRRVDRFDHVRQLGVGEGLGGGLGADLEGGRKTGVLGGVGRGGAGVGGGGSGIGGPGLGDVLGIVGGICRRRGVGQRGLCVGQGLFGLGNGGIPHQFDTGVIVVVAIVGFGPFGQHLGPGVLARGDGGFGGRLGDVWRNGVFGGIGGIVGCRRSSVGGAGRGGGRASRGLRRRQTGGRSRAAGPVGNGLRGVSGNFRRGVCGAGKSLGANGRLRGEGRLRQRGGALAQRHVDGRVGGGLRGTGSSLGLFGKTGRQRAVDVLGRLHGFFGQARGIVAF